MGLIEAHKTIWASEDFWSEAEWGGAACWAKLFNQNFVRANLTATISWSTIWSVYPVVDGEWTAASTVLPVACSTYTVRYLPS